VLWWGLPRLQRGSLRAPRTCTWLGEPLRPYGSSNAAGMAGHKGRCLQGQCQPVSTCCSRGVLCTVQHFGGLDSTSPNAVEAAELMKGSWPEWNSAAPAVSLLALHCSSTLDCGSLRDSRGKRAPSLVGCWVRACLSSTHCLAHLFRWPSAC
jgi:hypothetical protein